MTISGLGPHGERAAPPERVTLLPEDKAAAKARAFRVAVVLHTLESDWARQQLSGIVGVLGDCGTVVTHVIDCGFSPTEQVKALDGLMAQKPDAVVSLPVANQEVALAHARLAEAGIKLILLDNAPTGLLPGTHYGTLVSADNFGLGLIAAASCLFQLSAILGEMGIDVLHGKGVEIDLVKAYGVTVSRCASWCTDGSTHTQTEIIGL